MVESRSLNRPLSSSRSANCLSPGLFVAPLVYHGRRQELPGVVHRRRRVDRHSQVELGLVAGATVAGGEAIAALNTAISG